jgi:hypothetical protein
MAAEALWVYIHRYGFEDALKERKLLPMACLDPGLRRHPARSLVTMLTVLPGSQRVWKELIICRCLVNHEVHTEFLNCGCLRHKEVWL